MTNSSWPRSSSSSTRRSRRRAAARERLAVGVLDAAAPRLDVGAVDRAARRARARGSGTSSSRAQPLDLGLERRRRPARASPRRRARRTAALARRARSAPPRRPGRRRAPRRRSGTRSPSSPRPASRAAARRARGSSRPRRARRPRPRAARGTRAGRRARRGGRCAARRRAPRRRARARAVRRLEHLGSSTRTPAELVDVEEAPVPAGPRVEVEEPRAQLRVAPERVLVVGRHVVRDDVEHHAQPASSAAAERAQRLAAELVRDARRVDDVVAVRRARPRLQHGREVEVADPELAQVRHELARVAEASGPARAGAGRSARHGVTSVDARWSRTSASATRRPTPRARADRPAVARRGRRSRARAAQRRPKRRGGSVKTHGSWWALKRSRNESSTTGSPCGVARRELLAVQEDAERGEPPAPSPGASSCGPSGRNHHESGSAVALALAGEEARAPEHGMLVPQRDQPPRELEQPLAALVEAPSRTTRSRCPGSTRCCCRPACGRDLVAADQHRHALREEERREEVPLLPLAQRVDPGIVRRPLDAAVPAAVVVGAVAVVLEVRLVVLARCRRRGR